MSRSHISAALAPRRAAKPAHINLADLTRCVQVSIARTDEYAAFPERPMVTGSAFEKMYREYQRSSDRFSCFLACLSGALGAAAPDAAAQIFAFIEHVQRDNTPPVAADPATTERSTTPCEQ